MFKSFMAEIFFLRKCVHHRIKLCLTKARRESGLYVAKVQTVSYGFVTSYDRNGHLKRFL